jgi:phenylalanyl-tRNA synthetase beta chain
VPGGGVVHAPVSWIADFVSLPAGLSARELGEAYVRVGLEIEGIDSPGDTLTGPIVVGRVLSVEPEPQKNGKTINWCQVDVGGSGPRGIVCGAHNFAAGDLVVTALPGAVLPGGFGIAARKTYGHVSDGMICSVGELGIGDDAGGILVLPPNAGKPGDDALDVLGLRESVLEIAVTPDRGYCLSMRGLAREAAVALDVPFRDVADLAIPVPDDAGYPVRVDDPAGCDQFSARVVTGIDPGAPSPDWMQRRLRAAGMRSISLAVDITNYVMLETGQPLHAFDRARLRGPICVRRAKAGEKLTTLDGTVRTLHPDDLLVTDDSGVIALAGVMGGASTEVGPATTDVVLEAAHWDPSAIARAVRRHRLPSEAAKRFERGVDPAIAGVALRRCVDLLVEFGAATAAAGYTVVGDGPAPVSIELRPGRPAELAGLPIAAQAVVTHLTTVGCTVAGEDVLRVRPPSWRPDLTDPADLVEEVVRLVGYDAVPSVLPASPPGRGLTPAQQLRRAVSRALAGAGFTEVLSYPFVATSVHDTFGLGAGDERRRAARLINPLSEAEPELRTSLLPGLLATLARNEGRGARDVAIFEMGLVYLPQAGTAPVPRPGVEHRPTDEELAGLDAIIPRQPRHVAAVLAGQAERSGWWGAGRPVTWADSVEAARVVARAARVELQVRPAGHAPWHPGRCGALLLDGQVVGYAGELHPRVIAAMDLPHRTCAVELDLDTFDPPGPVTAPTVSAFPPVLLDVALVVDARVPAAGLQEAVREGAGTLLESVRLFDLYVDGALRDAGKKSVAFALRLRAPDRTLTIEEAILARDAAVARAAQLYGARLRG